MLELVLTGLVSQAVAHYGKKAFTLVDEQFLDLLSRGRGGDADAVREADRLLAERVVANPEAVDQLVDELLSLPEPKSDAPTPRLAKYEELLNGVLATAHGLRPALVALPGWFHTDACVTVIDARPGEMTDYRAPQKMWGGGLASLGRLEPHFHFWPFDEAVDAGMPRVWLVECRGRQEAVELAESVRVRCRAASPPDARFLRYRLPEFCSVEEDRILEVAAVYERKVEVRRLKDPVNRRKHPGETDIQYDVRLAALPPTTIELLISDSAGFRLLRQTLRTLVADQAREEAQWLEL